jgi:hypothetical protein
MQRNGAAPDLVAFLFLFPDEFFILTFQYTKHSVRYSLSQALHFKLELA